MNSLDSSEQHFLMSHSETRLNATNVVWQNLAHLNPVSVSMHPLGFLEVDWGSVKTYRIAVETFPIPLTYKINDDEIIQVRHKYKD